jgi:hypothetical protein
MPPAARRGTDPAFDFIGLVASQRGDSLPAQQFVKRGYSM